MDAADLSGHDLNLLVALQALLDERHVSRAAARLGMSQPAMSRALSRLRDMFDDPLFIRSRSGMEPTARALALRPIVEQVLAHVAAMVRTPTFDPGQATGTVRIAAPDIVTYMLVPPLMRALAEQAPGLVLEVTQWVPDWYPHLRSGAIDLTVGIPEGTEPNVYARHLLDNHWACVLRKGHPALRRKWTREHFARLDHLMVSLTGRAGTVVDTLLARAGLERRIALRVPYPALTPLLVAETDLVLTTTRWLALKLSRAGELVVRRPPIPLPPVRLPMVWHERSHRDPEQVWLREKIAGVARQIDPRAIAWP